MDKSGLKLRNDLRLPLMLNIPDIPPKITGITFEVFRSGVTSPDKKTFLYDPEENVHGDSLNDPSREYNQYFQNLVVDENVISARVSISFDHSIRPLLPIPGHRKCAHLDSIGSLIGVMVDMMAASGEFPDSTPENELILHVAALAGRTMNNQAAAPRL